MATARSKRKAAAKAPAWKPPPAAVAAVGIERNGLHVRDDGVPHGEIGNVCRYLVCLFDALARETHGATVPGPDVVPGGSPVYVFDDEWGEDGRRRRRPLGFG